VNFVKSINYIQDNADLIYTWNHHILRVSGRLYSLIFCRKPCIRNRRHTFWHLIIITVRGWYTINILHFKIETSHTAYMNYPFKKHKIYSKCDAYIILTKIKCLMKSVKYNLYYHSNGVFVVLGKSKLSNPPPKT